MLSIRLSSKNSLSKNASEILLFFAKSISIRFASKINFLSLFTERARNIIRAGDEVFRLEEDLFILLLPHCPNDGAIVLMERIKRNLQQQPWEPIPELNLSTSAATWSTGETSQELQKRLLQSLTKQQKTTLQLAAFSEQWLEWGG